MEVQEAAVGELAAPAETLDLGEVMGAVGPARAAQVRTVARAQVVARGWPERAQVVKQAKLVERVRRAAAVKRGKRGKRVRRVPPVQRAPTARRRCHFGSIGSMSKGERRR